MKKIAFVIGLCLLWAASGECTTNQPQILGQISVSTSTATGGWSFLSLPIASINTLIATTTGQYITCTDCTQSALCVSSGSVNAGAWVIATDTGVFAGSTYSGKTHCK